MSMHLDVAFSVFFHGAAATAAVAAREVVGSIPTAAAFLGREKQQYVCLPRLWRSRLRFAAAKLVATVLLKLLLETK